MHHDANLQTPHLSGSRSHPSGVPDPMGHAPDAFFVWALQDQFNQALQFEGKLFV